MSSDLPYDPEPDLSESESVDATPCAYTEYTDEGADPDEVPATGEGSEGLAADVWDALYDVEDPEMPVSIVDLGLIYGVEVDDSAATARNDARDGATVQVDMTLTYSGCPAREMLLSEVKESVEAVDGVAAADLRLVWSPEWNLDMVTERGRERLNEFGLSV